MNKSRTRIFAIFLIAVIAVVSIAAYIFTVSRRSRAALGPTGANIVITPATASNLLIDSVQTATVTVTPVTQTYLLSGIDITIMATGPIQIIDVTAPSGLPVELFKQKSDKTARIVYAQTSKTGTLPALTQFQIQYKAVSAGSGTIVIDNTKSEVTGTLTTASFALDSVNPTTTLTFIAPSPTPTLTPTPTLSPTNTPMPTVAPTLNFSITPENVTYGSTVTFTWSATGATTCTASGGWTGTKSGSGTETVGPITSNATYTLTCTGATGTVTVSRTINLSATPTPTQSPTPSLSPTPTATPTPTPCPTRNLGDANCDGKANLADFEYWRREYIKLVETTTADFSGNGTVGLEDFEYWRTRAFN